MGKRTAAVNRSCWLCYWNEKVLLVLVFLMKPHMFAVSLGTSLPSSGFCPGNKSPFFIPDSSAEGRGQGLKTKPKPNSPNAPGLAIRSRGCGAEQRGAGPALPRAARSGAAGPAPAALQDDESHAMLQKLLGRAWRRAQPSAFPGGERGDAAAGSALGKRGSAAAVPGRWVPEQRPRPTQFAASGLVFDAARHDRVSGQRDGVRQRRGLSAGLAAVWPSGPLLWLYVVSFKNTLLLVLEPQNPIFKALQIQPVAALYYLPLAVKEGRWPSWGWRLL